MSREEVYMGQSRRLRLRGFEEEARNEVYFRQRIWPVDACRRCIIAGLIRAPIISVADRHPERRRRHATGATQSSKNNYIHEATVQDAKACR